MVNGPNSEFAGLIEALGSESIPHREGIGRRERKAAETRLKLFRCAIQLFADRGYSNITVEDITEAADVGKGTFFNYFESKDHVLSVMAEIQLGKVRIALQAAEDGKRSIRSVLRSLFAQVCEEPGRSPDLARALLTAFLSSSIRSSLAQNLGHGLRMVTRIVELGQKRSEIDPRLKADQVALHFQQSFIGTMLLWSVRGEQTLISAAQVSFQHFWKAIAKN